MPNNTTILVVEPSNALRNNLCKFLEEQNFVIFEAGNGEEGVEIAGRQIPDFILCADILPDMNGFEVMKILGTIKETKDIPFIYLIAQLDELEKGLGLSIDDYVTKPISHEVLMSKFNSKVSRKARIANARKRSKAILDSLTHHVDKNDEFLSLKREGEIKKVQKKHYVYSEGETPHWLYWVLEGRIKIFKINGSGKELITQIIRPGEFFGYKAIISQTAYMDNAVAVENATLRLLPKRDYIEIMSLDIEFTNWFTRKLAELSQIQDQKLLDIAYSSVRKKVALALESFTATMSIKPEIQIDVSREDLANIAGTAKETLIRTLSDFKSEGILDIKEKKIIILDFDRLKSMPE